MSEEKLTPEQTIELEKARAETAKAAKETAELEEKSKRLDAQNRDFAVRDTFEREVLASGIRSNLSQHDLVKLLTSQPDVKIVPSADGKVLHCERNGEKVEFKTILEEFAIRSENQYLFDKRSLRRLKTDVEKVVCRDDLVDQEDKIAFISEHGSDAFGRLPQHRGSKPADPSKMSAQQWKDLPLIERARLCSVLTEEQRSRILQRTQEKK